MAPVPPWQPQPVGRAALLWGGAALLAALGHGGAVWYALQRPVPPELPVSPPEAVMIELAPETAAPQSDRMEFAPDLTDQREIVAPEALDTPEEPTMTEEVRTPATDFTPVAPPPELPPAAVPPTVVPEVVLPPPPRRLTEPPPPVETEKKAEKARPPAPKKEQRTARSDTARAAPKAVARESGAGSAGAAAEASWQSKLSQHLNRRKRYPRAARSRHVEGVAQVRFTVDQSGNILSSQLLRSSGSAELDGEALALMKRASPVPPPPDGAGRTITVPIRFNLR